MQNHSNTPVFILAGGFGTRLSEETGLKPKPMVEVGDFPILIHIMRHYYRFGFNDFVICAGYKAWEIKNYFLNYRYRHGDLEIDLRSEKNTSPLSLLDSSERNENWRVRVIDTGANAMTGSRIARAFDAIKLDDFENFAVTYGDGLTDANLETEFQAHLKQKSIGTVLGVRPRARFGELDISASGKVRKFLEKPQSRQGFINGGYFFFKREFRKYLNDADNCVLEKGPLEKLARDGELEMFQHEGFWQPMDTLHDKRSLEALWLEGRAPWAPPRSKQKKAKKRS
jgi:glucose-1-phosphate cytidylyltransferase